MDTRFTVEESNLYCLTISLAVKPDCIFAWESRSEEQSVTLEGGQMAKLLRYIVHILEIFMWEQDYCLNPDEDDFFTDIFPEEGIYIDDLEEKDEALPAEPEGRPSWQVHIEYSNHAVQDICSYEDYLPDRPEELYLSFMEYFEPDEDSFEFI